MKYGYIRVSTDDQNIDRQIDGLKDECDELRVERGVSATARTRPVYDTLMNELKPGDTFVVWNLDRAYRSTVDAIVEADKMNERGIGFKIITLNIDTTTPAGRMIYTLLAAMAEWERSNLIERTNQGIASAKARGVHTGRPKALAPDQKRHIRAQIESKAGTTASMASLFNVSKRTIQRVMSEPPK